MEDICFLAEELGGSNTTRMQVALLQAGHANACARLRHTKGPSMVGTILLSPVAHEVA